MVIYIGVPRRLWTRFGQVLVRRSFPPGSGLYFLLTHDLIFSDLSVLPFLAHLGAGSSLSAQSSSCSRCVASPHRQIRSRGVVCLLPLIAVYLIPLIDFALSTSPCCACSVADDPCLSTVPARLVLCFGPGYKKSSTIGRGPMMLHLVLSGAQLSSRGSLIRSPERQRCARSSPADACRWGTSWEVPCP